MKSVKTKLPSTITTVAQPIAQHADPSYLGQVAQAAAMLDEYEAAKESLAKWKAADPRGTPTEIALRDERLAKAQHEFDAIEGKLRTLRGDFGDLPNAVPASSAGTAGASPASPPPSTAPSNSSPNRGPVLKRSAMVKKLDTVWQGISSDLQHSDKNGLATAAKAPGHGNWYEDDALTWARQRGKVGVPPATKNAANSMFDLPGERHLIEG